MESSSDTRVMVVFASNWRHGMPLGGGGVPWYGDIAFTLPTPKPHGQDTMTINVSVNPLTLTVAIWVQL